MAVQIDWRLAGQQPDFVGNALKSYQGGQQMAQQADVRNALSQYGTDPEGAQSALVRAGALPEASALAQYGERQRGQALDRKVAPMVASGDYTGARAAAGEAGNLDLVNTLTDQQAKHASRLASLKADVSDRLLQIPAPNGDMTARNEALKQMLPDIVAQGIPAEAIGKQPLTDDYLKQSVSDGLSLAERIAARKPISVTNGTTLFDPATRQPIFTNPKEDATPAGYVRKPDGSLDFIKGGPADPDVIKRTATDKRQIIVSMPVQQQGGGTPELDPTSLDYVANQYRITGQLPPLGMGKSAASMRSAIISRAAALDAGDGKGGADAVGTHADYKANAGALTQITKQASMIESFETTAKQNGQQVRQLLTKGAGPATQWFNTPIQALRQKGLGDENVSSLNTAIQVYTGEVAKIVSGSTGSQGSTDAMRRETANMLNPNATPRQILASMDVLDRDMANRTEGLRTQAKSLRAQIKGGSGASTTAGGARPSLDDIFGKH